MEAQLQAELSTTEQALLTQCERQIHGAIVAQGAAFKAIRDNQLWRGHYTNFRHYMRDRWDWTEQYADELIRHYNTYQETELELAKHDHYRQLEKASYATIRLCADLIASLDKVDAKTIKALVEVITQAVNTGAIELNEGEQLRLNQISALQAAALLEQVETRKRELTHLTGKRTPVATFKGVAMEYLGARLRGALAIDDDRQVASIEVFKSDKGFTIRGLY